MKTLPFLLLYILWIGQSDSQSLTVDTVIGDDAVLQCSSDLSSLMGSTITWQFSSGPSNIVSQSGTGDPTYETGIDTSKYVFSTTDKSLTIKNTITSDSGNYLCFDSGPGNSGVTTTTTLTVYSGFTFPSNVISASVTEASSDTSVTVTVIQVSSTTPSSQAFWPRLSITDKNGMEVCTATTGSCQFTTQSGRFPYTATATLESESATLNISEKCDPDPASCRASLGLSIIIIIIAIVAVMLIIAVFCNRPRKHDASLNPNREENANNYDDPSRPNGKANANKHDDPPRPNEEENANSHAVVEEEKRKHCRKMLVFAIILIVIAALLAVVAFVLLFICATADCGREHREHAAIACFVVAGVIMIIVVILIFIAWKQTKKNRPPGNGSKVQ